MPSINMIAPRRAEKRRLERDMRRLVIVIAVELVFAVGLGGWVATKMFTTRSRIADLDVQIANFQPTLKQIEQYDSATAKITPKLQLLRQAKSGTMLWYNTLDRLTQSLPSSTWLTRISTGSAKPDEHLAVNLTGVSASQAKVGETMMRLHTNEDLRGVNLHFTRATDVGDAAAFEFEIGAGLPTGRESKEVTKNGTSES